MSTTSSQDYAIVRMHSGAFNDLIFIAQSAFGVLLDEKKLNKKFDTQFTGVANLGFIAYSTDHTPSAYYGVFPVFMLIDGVQYLVAQSGDTMTHTNHQGKGLFVKLARESYQLAASNGVQLIFGFPNGNSYPGFVKKLDWNHEKNLVKYTKRINTVPLAALAARYNSFKKFYKYFTKRHIQKRAFFGNSLLETGENGVLRDQNFWNYKAYSDNFTFNASGVKVWAKIDGVLLVGDIEYKEGTDYAKVLKKIAGKAFFLGCHKIVFQCSSHTWLSNILENTYQSEVGLPIGYLKLNEHFPDKELKFTMADFDTF